MATRISSCQASTVRPNRIYFPVIAAVICWLAVASTLAPHAASGANLPEFHKTVNEVQLEMVAVDSAGIPITNLSSSDLQVAENGTPVRQFGLSSAQDLPLFLTLIYDTSESNRTEWMRMREPVTHFLEQTVTGKDELWIAAFDRTLRFRTKVDGKAQFQRALSSPSGRDNITAFNDALLAALRDQFATGQARRSAMIVLSDGEDNDSLHSLMDVVAEAQQQKIAIYTIRRPRKHDWGDGAAVLHHLAAQTGGRDFTVRNTREIEQAFAAIRRDLRSCYVLYYPSRTGQSGEEFRSIRVTPRNKRIQIRVQNGYYAHVEEQGGE